MKGSRHSTADHGGATQDAQWVQRAKAGDRDAWLALYRAHVGELFGYCYNELGSAQEAEDVVAESFLRAVRGLPRFDGRSSFRTWLYSIARNQLRDRWRRAGRRPRTVPLDHAAGQPQPEHGLADANTAPSRSRSTVLGQRMLEALPARYAEVLRLRVMEGRSVHDTAEAMGTTPGNVKVLQHRALKRARLVAEAWQAEDAVQGLTQVGIAPLAGSR